MHSNTGKATLHRLLDANAQFALDARGTTNHLPMALVALSEMGASPQRLQAFFDQWAEKYAIVASQPPIPIKAGTWLEQLGHPDAFGSLLKYFNDAISAGNAADVLREVLGQAPFAPASLAFHALIRLAYGIQPGHAGEIAAGLAACVATNLSCDIDLSGRAGASSVMDGLSVFSARMGGRAWQGNITGKLTAVFADADFADALLLPPVTSALLDEIASAAIRLYWQAADFTVLHMVTGVHAARIVLASLPAELADAMYPAIWTAFCAAYVSVGAPAFVPVDAAPATASWPEVLQRATESNDEHRIKMAHSCHVESLRASDPLYLASATRILQINPS